MHAQVVGEHGDSEVVLWSSAHVGGTPLREWPGWSPEREQPIATEVRTAAYEIIKRKGATNHAIGLTTAALLRSALRGERRVLTVSRVQTGALGLRDVALSLPTIVDEGGAVEVIPAEARRRRARRGSTARPTCCARRSRRSRRERVRQKPSPFVFVRTRMSWWFTVM